MADLTEDERGIISENPLGHSLDDVREALRNAEGDTQGEAWLEAVSELVTAFLASRACLRLASRIENRYYLVSNLGLIGTRLVKHDLPIQVFRPLSQLVLNQASDIDIWTAVISLVDSVVESARPSTPTRIPKTIPASSNTDTPFVHRSHLDQTLPLSRPQVEEQVFCELKYCTYRSVGRFHEKYFQGREWNNRAEELWRRAKSRYNASEKKWSFLSNEPDEQEVCTWWLGMQEDFLNTERAAYYRSDGGNKVGLEDQRQLDIFVKMTNSAEAHESGGKHLWQGVLVVSEFKRAAKQSFVTLFKQLSSAVRNVFAWQPTRLFVHSFTLTGSDLEPWVFDRSGAYGGKKFNIHMEPEKFFQVLCGYLMMSDDELGLNTFTKKQDDGTLVVNMPPVDTHATELIKLQLKSEPIAHPRALVCRATTCFLAKTIGEPEYNKVVKFSWISSMRQSEAELLKKAKEHNVTGLVEVVGYKERIASFSSLRDGLAFPAPYKFRDNPEKRKNPYSILHTPSAKRSASRSSAANQSLSHASHTQTTIPLAGPSRSGTQGSLSRHNLANVTRAPLDINFSAQDSEGSYCPTPQNETPYDDRILHVLAIEPSGSPLTEYGSILELLECLRDAIEAHRSLYMDGKILHRDISINNIIITDPAKANGKKGVLIDLDLAKNMDEGPSGARHRTGTIEFMAVGVLRGEEHTYRHDLESFLYVLIWLCFVYGAKGHGTKPKNAPPDWSKGSPAQISLNKRGDMSCNFEDLMEKLPAECGECVEKLIGTIKTILFPMPNDGTAKPYSGTPENPDDMYVRNRISLPTRPKGQNTKLMRTSLVRDI
ncbi:hypothetical protein E4U30_006127 [Claviceps sp. LM220 group G6]|nr:hypothetical protein E4U30_006127 [Claviceps sp. LM220 group G6]